MSKKKGKNGVALMKNYYEILEVNSKASQEVIEKAYKVLIKKYHPDLYYGEKQQYAERKTKEINEAYQVLSDEFLKGQYDTELAKQQQSNRQNSYNLERERVPIKEEAKEDNQLKQKKNKQKYEVGTLGAIIDLMKELIQDLAKTRQRGKEIKGTTKKDVLAIVLTIIIVILIGIILWFIPFTNGWMRELLFENPLFNWIGGLFE